MSDLSPNRIVEAMNRLLYPMDCDPGEINIVYIEGMNRDGSHNDDAPDKWNDLRCVIAFTGDVPVMAGLWDDVTTKPGYYYDSKHVINAKGAAIIALGQHRAWQVGFHHQDQKRPALVQTGGPVTVLRDRANDFSRNGQPDTGYFGINQHDGQDGDPSTIGAHSAGCLVVRRLAEQMAFMALVKNDPRYIKDNSFVFTTTVLRAADVIGATP